MFRIMIRYPENDELPKGLLESQHAEFIEAFTFNTQFQFK